MITNCRTEQVEAKGLPFPQVQVRRGGEVQSSMDYHQYPTRVNTKHMASVRMIVLSLSSSRTVKGIAGDDSTQCGTHPGARSAGGRTGARRR